MARRLASNRRGFTLVEVLVALLIMSIIAALGWQGVASMARSREIGQAASERTMRLSTVVAQWEQDLLNVYDSPLVPGVQFDGSALRLLRRSDGGVQLVVWALRDGRWLRWASPVLTRGDLLQQAWLASQQQQGNEPGQLVLAEGVTGWQLFRLSQQGVSNLQSSGDLAVGTPQGTGGATTTRLALPPGVRLQIDLPEGRLTRDVMLAPQFPLS